MLLRLALSLGFLLMFWAACALAGEIKIIDPWVAEPPPGAKMVGGYMEIANNSAQDIRLIQIVAEDFLRVEMHQTVIKDDTAQMVKQQQLTITAGNTLILQPGSFHLMLMMPKRALRRGDATELLLRFDNGEEMAVTAPIREKSDRVQ